MILYRYILRAHVGPFFFSFFSLILIFLLQFLMKYIDQLIGKGLGFWVIAELIVLNLAWIVVLAVPMSVLVAVLMAFGGLSANNEVTVIKSSGMSLYKMMFPVFLVSLVITGLLIIFNNRVLPDANHRLKVLMIDIHRKKPTLTLHPGIFSTDISGYAILVRKTYEHTNEFEDATIYNYSDPMKQIIITAKRGKISFTPDYKKLIMDLENGEIHEQDVENKNLYRIAKYEKYRVVMEVEGFGFERSPDNAFQRGDRELSAEDMLRIVDSLKNIQKKIYESLNSIAATNFKKPFHGELIMSSSFYQSPVRDSIGDYEALVSAIQKLISLNAVIKNYLTQIEYYDRSIDAYMVEVHKKYAIPFACVVFVLVGAPLGMMARRGNFGVAASLSLFFFLFYWACLIGGEKLADRDILSPFLSMWIANLVVGLLGIYLTIRMGKEAMIIDWYRIKEIMPQKVKTWLGIPEEEEILTDRYAR
ncbi:LptF/LptG family permease [Candidatus Kryptobacter tengchongensis]|uniref:LptF/LptG family permease n=1 Tax=Kryptobacter tengchongensis TaxID=1643429 RepID=UPI000707B45A|nr:LptF/LptG family permease [Candidatus Kryptobacter tengchongensis]CUS85360.1 lipopolysaccharide export system permease protein [Candidatus Kryptobacter tengchongensis]